MHKKITALLCCILAAGWFAFQGASSGVALIQNADRTGAPGSSANCSQCHSGGNFNATLGHIIRDTATGQQVTSVNGGQTYVVIWKFKHFGATRFGFQGTCRTSGNANAGTFATPAPNTAVRTVAGKNVVEHIASSPVDSFGTLWTAPTNEDTVFFYGSGNAANGNGGTSGDQYAALVSPSMVLVSQPVGEEEVSQKAVNIYPTPASHTLFVEGVFNTQYTIYDLSGRSWMNGAVTPNGIDVGILPVGAYLIKLEGDHNDVKKFIVAR